MGFDEQLGLDHVQASTQTRAGVGWEGGVRPGQCLSCRGGVAAGVPDLGQHGQGQQYKGSGVGQFAAAEGLFGVPFRLVESVMLQSQAGEGVQAVEEAGMGVGADPLGLGDGVASQPIS
jgi:hypothetical protein